VAPYDTLYLIITGASTARRAPDLLRTLVTLAPRVVVLPTPNSQRIVSPRELALIAGHRVVESYFDEAILPRPEPGVLLVAPCDFNSLNKLAQGLADNLPLSVAAEAIGRGTPVIVAISVNPPLWAHPRAKESAQTLRGWGCDVLDPVPDGEWLTLAPDDDILSAVRARLSGAAGRSRLTP
jgi:phosphopantothenoylcysteine synthetase/decarboxylase